MGPGWPVGMLVAGAAVLMTTHALKLTDRGTEHVHRWSPACKGCPWVGVARRRKAEAVEQHRKHANTAERVQRQQVSPNRPRARKPTPHDQLPEALQ
jgi:hypothetical protein